MTEGDSVTEPDRVKAATLAGARWFGLTRSLAELTTMLAAVALARLVSPADFGRLAVAIVASEFAMMIANESIGTPLVQRPTVRRDHLEAATFVGLVVGIGLALLTLFVVPLLTTPLFGHATSRLFQLFAPAFAIAGIQIVPLARLQRDLAFRRIGVVEVVGVLVSSLTSVGLAVLGLGARAYVLGVIAGLVAATIGYLAGSPPVLPRWRPREMRELISFGLPATAAGFAGVSYRNIDYLILGVRLPTRVVGFYYRAFTLGVEYERRLSGIVARLAFPVYARTADPATRLTMRLRIVRVNVALVYPMLTLFIAVAPTAVPWVFGARWAPAVLPAQILAIAGMASCVRNLTSPSVLAAGKPSWLFAFSAVETVLYGATVWVASAHGLVTVCLAVSTFQVISLVSAYGLLLRGAIGTRWQQIVHDLGPTLLACAPLFAACAGTRLATAHLPSVVTVAATGAAGLLVYPLALRRASPAAWADIALLLEPLLLQRLRAPRPRRRAKLVSAVPKRAE